MDRFTLGGYTVIFDEQGASIEQKCPPARSRISATTATNAMDFMRYHRTVCLAMMNNRPEDLAIYQLQEPIKKVAEDDHL